MKRQKSCGPWLGKLVIQFLEVITFSYDLCLGHTIAHWKGIIKEIHFRGSIKVFGYQLEARSQKTFI
jgi:hypothetical protein